MFGIILHRVELNELGIVTVHKHG